MTAADSTDRRLIRPRVELHVRDLARTFNRRPVLERLSFTARAGEVLAVTGPNGAGKSTLLRIVAGLLRPSRGELRWVSAGGSENVEDRRPVIGYLAPDLNPYDELTAAENLALLGRIRGGRPAELRVRERLAAVGLDAERTDPAGSLSSGQRQRLRLALALLGDPDVLVLDEPGNGLDDDGRRLLAACLESARGRGPVLLATNDPEEMKLGDRELRLDPVERAPRGGG